MNVKPLLKYFPEIHHLSLHDQQTLLEQSDQLTFSPENKIRLWGGNMLGLTGLLILTFLVVAVLGPRLNLAASTTGGLLMLVVFPLFIFLQHRRRIATMRAALNQILKAHPSNPEHPNN